MEIGLDFLLFFLFVECSIYLVGSKVFCLRNFRFILKMSYFPNEPAATSSTSAAADGSSSFFQSEHNSSGEGVKVSVLNLYHFIVLSKAKP